MPDTPRSAAQSLAALQVFRAMQSEVDGPIDEESGLEVADLDAAIAAMEAHEDMTSIPVIDLRRHKL